MNKPQLTPPGKTWRLNQFVDPLTDKIIGLETVPENDLRPHVSSQDCVCIPQVETRNGVRYLTHFALDNRDQLQGH